MPKILSRVFILRRGNVSHVHYFWWSGNLRRCTCDTHVSSIGLVNYSNDRLQPLLGRVFIFHMSSLANMI